MLANLNIYQQAETANPLRNKDFPIHPLRNILSRAFGNGLLFGVVF
jgi:hypothetical protein